MSRTTCHLDLGCGPNPRNPYSRSRVFGLDVRPIAPRAGVEFRVANLVLDPIPFDDNSFDSVSAYDFIEHIPRLLPTADGKATVMPFVRLVSEVWRVLVPGGMFYALTPAYPAPQALQDPTHVNFITEATHQYFCGPSAYGRIYGFVGDFHARRAEWVVPDDALTPRPRTVAQRWRRWRRGLQGRLTHFVWELEAVKPMR